MGTMESMVDKNIAKMEAQLKLWGAKFSELMAKANVDGQQAKIDSRKELDELKSKLEVAQSKLDEAKADGKEKWEVLKQGVEHTWAEIESTFKKLVH
jgi:multidrug resistance efflux pump